MKPIKWIVIGYCLFLLSCAGRLETSSTTEPIISEGYYATSEPVGIPLVVIRKTAGNTHSYSLLNYQCANKDYSNFGHNGTAFDQSPNSIPGPHVMSLSDRCEIEADIVAQSDSTIHISIKENKQALPPYPLTKVDKDAALQLLISQAGRSATFSISEKACMGGFDDSCANLKVPAKISANF